MGEVVARLNRSRRPVIYAGVEIERFGLMRKLVRLAEMEAVPASRSEYQRLQIIPDFARSVQFVENGVQMAVESGCIGALVKHGQVIRSEPVAPGA